MTCCTVGSGSETAAKVCLCEADFLHSELLYRRLADADQPVFSRPYRVDPHAGTGMSVHERTSPEDPADETATLADLLAANEVRSLYQPVVELDSGTIVAYEALARGPEGTSLCTPAQLFAEARRCGLLAELDMACRTAALSGARAAGMHRLWTLFVNTEPDTAASAFGPSPAGVGILSATQGEMRVIVELTEHSLIDNPVELLHLVDRIRAQGWGIALDDVGADRASLALLPLLRPDVIKLDMRLIQQRASADVVEIVGAVNAEAERSGSIIVAEGIETPAHRDAALALGATHGQGWLFGRPAALPTRLPPFTGSRIAVSERPPPYFGGTPFELGAAVSGARTGTKQLLMEFSKHLERQAAKAGETAILLATFQHASLFNDKTQARYATLVEEIAFLGVLGEQIGLEPLPGIRGGLLAENDPLLDEWDMAVIAPHYAATLTARDLGDEDTSTARRFTFTFSHDRELAIAVATYLMSRISPHS